MSEEKSTPGGSNELGEILSGLREWLCWLLESSVGFLIVKHS